MWRIRFKETKEPFTVTTKIGFAPVTGLSTAEVDRAEVLAAELRAAADVTVPIRRRGGMAGKYQKTKRKSPSPRALPMPRGCKRQSTIAERADNKADLKQQHKVYEENKKERKELMKAGIKLDEVWKNPKPYIAKAVRVCIMCGKCGKYYLTYRDQSRVIAALRTSTALQECGVSWKALELVNWHGYTMENMVNWPVETGFALRHKNENWYWMSGKKRVWFSRPGDAQGAWTRDEKVLALQENRKKRRPMGLVMVCCATGGDVKAMPNWLI